jgi:hypothetical protein
LLIKERPFGKRDLESRTGNVFLKTGPKIEQVVEHHPVDIFMVKCRESVKKDIDRKKILQFIRPEKDRNPIAKGREIWYDPN